MRSLLSLAKRFDRPEAQRTPGYFWMGNDRLSVVSLKRQIDEMAACGARTVFFHPLPRGFREDIYTAMEPEYLSSEYFEIMRQLADYCAARKLNFFIYDEGGWPSGSACGQVYAADPGRFGERMLVRCEDGGVTVRRMEPHPERHAPAVSSLCEEATRMFLHLTHDGYANAMGRHFGSTVRYVFTDEPQCPGCFSGSMDWCDDFPEEFLARKGYDIRPYLGDILALPPGARGAMAERRLDLCDVQSQLFSERYLLPLRGWCRAHSLLSGGHFNLDHDFAECGQCSIAPLRMARLLDMPGIDAIWQQIFPGKTLVPYPKVASSAAHQIGRKETIGELFAVYGSSLTPWEMRYVLNFTMLCGINTFIFSNIAQSWKGARVTGYRPHFGPADPLWNFFPSLHQYVSRMGTLLAEGTPDTDVALYLDQRTLWLGGKATKDMTDRLQDIAMRLLHTQRDFDYVDDDILSAGRLRNGILRCGKAAYRFLVVPTGIHPSAATKRRLQQLHRAGFPVLQETQLDSLPRILRGAPSIPDIMVRKYRLPGGRSLFFLFNSGLKAVHATLQMEEGEGPLAFANPETGEFSEVFAKGGKWKWDFQPGEASCFLAGNCPGAKPAPERPGRCLHRLTQWKFRLYCRFFPTPRGHFRRYGKSPYMHGGLGDWRQTLGNDFSGWAEYATTFRHTENDGIAFLDLGDVKYACMVILNGKTVGTCVWTPYRLDIRKALRAGENRLVVLVSNTAANSFQSEKLRREWLRHYPKESPYEKYHRVFEQQNLPSGLYGPVRLLGAAFP